MYPHGLQRRLVPALFLVTLLLAAQFGAAVHAFEHDLDAPQVKVCGTCITVAQLGSACQSSPLQCTLEFSPERPADTSKPPLSSVRQRCPQARGPPSPPDID